MSRHPVPCEVGTYEATIERIFSAAKKFHSMVSIADGETPQPDPELPGIPMTPAMACLKLAFTVWQEWLVHAQTAAHLNAERGLRG